MNWFERYPEDLAAQSSPSEALQAVRESDVLDALAQETLDFVLIDWVMRFVSRGSDLEGVVELQQLCRIACTLLGQTPAERAMHSRWQGLNEVLEAKRLAIRFAKAAPIVPLLHEEEILNRLEGGHALPQSVFVEELKLSPGRVSQILRVLESRNKIKRERRGKESWVCLSGASIPTKPFIPVPVATVRGWGELLVVEEETA